MKKYLLLIGLLTYGMGICILHGQSLESIQNKLAEYTDFNPQEKLHVHTDKGTYAAGETIWYKLYSAIGLENKLSILSNIAYVELLNPQGEIVTQKINSLFTGVGVGEIALTDTLVEGSYRLRAYTNWMRNSDSDYYFEKVLNIGNVRSDNVITASSKVTKDGQEYYLIQLTQMDGSNWSKKTTINYEFLDEKSVIDKGRETMSEDGVIKVKITPKNKGKNLSLRFENQDQSIVKKLIVTQSFFSENSLQAFPEGGHILPDEINRIAFKALNPQGKGIKAQLIVLSSKQDTAGIIQTNELGMGSSPIYIGNNETYTVRAKFADDSEKEIPLPQISSSGYSLNINQSNKDKVFIQVNQTEDRISENDLYLVVHHMGQIFYIAKQKASKKNSLFSFSKENLPSGIFTVSILNSNFLPVTERPVFNLDKNRLVNLDVKQNKTSYHKREKVENSLEITTENDSLKIAVLSASVINLNHYTKDYKEDINILTSMFLNADIKGFIENPAYYFREDGTVKTEELDDMLLTQGWRKINLAQLDSIQQDPKFKAEKGLSIEGYTRKIGRKAAFPNAKVQLISTHNFMNYIDTVSDLDGRFTFDDLIFPDSIKFLISAKDDKGKNNIDITTDLFESPAVNFEKNNPLIQNDLNKSLMDQLLASKKFHQQLENKGLMEKVTNIEEVVVTAVRSKASESSSNMNGPGNADQILSADDLSTCPSLDMCLTGRLTGVYFQGGIPYNTRGNVPMQVVMDGMYIEADMLATVNAMDVQSIEVLRNANYTAIYGSYGAGGLIIITSKTGRDARRTGVQPRGLLSIQPKGISISKEFYKPVYEVDSDKQFDTDLRNTIHWEPGIVTNDDGKASFFFYTSDEAGTYRMMIEGIDYDGRLVRKVVDFQVEE